MQSTSTSRVLFHFSLFAAAILALACNAKGGVPVDTSLVDTGSLGSDSSDTDDSSDTSDSSDSVDSSDTGDSSDTADTSVEPNPWAGSYDGDVAMEDENEHHDFCNGSMNLAINADGVLSGVGTCDVDGGPGGGSQLQVELTGEVTTSGDSSGTAIVSFPPEVPVDPVESEFSGGFSGSNLTIDWTYGIDTGGRPLDVSAEVRVH
jgi:hypothetical protein